MSAEQLAQLFLVLAVFYIYTALYLYRNKVIRYLNERPSWSPRVVRRQVLRYFEENRERNDLHLRYFRKQRYIGLIVLLFGYLAWRSLT